MLAGPRGRLSLGVKATAWSLLAVLTLAGCDSAEVAVTPVAPSAGAVSETAGVAASPSPESPTPSASVAAQAQSEPASPTPDPTQSSSSPSATVEVTEAAAGAAQDDHTALAALATLTVKGRAAKTGYSRDEFGPSWADVDQNGCDTRNDILARDLTKITYKKGTRDCVVAKGTLKEPYTATKISFVRGQTTSNAVQIDHVVALSDAWQKGAQKLDKETRRQFANDPLNLLAVDGPANMSKGDGDAATWLPPSKAYRCQYVARQVAVKAKYDLWVTKAEHAAIAKVLNTCPSQELPASESAGKAKVTATAAAPTPSPTKTTAKPKATKKPTATKTKQAVASVYYQNCTAARDAGAAPVPKGDPGYGKHLDRDGDGIGCE